MPGVMELFKAIRPRDINVEMGISLTNGEMTYYMFDEPALNSFDEELSMFRDSSTPYNIIGQRNDLAVKEGEHA